MIVSKSSNKFIKFDIVVILLLVVLAGWLRLYKLGQLPAGLHNDEASFLVNSHSLYKTGSDEDGRSFPLFLNSYIDPKPALFSYLQMPFLMVFGQTVFASRLPSALFGLCSLILASSYVWLLTKNKKLSLLILFLLTISPWHIMISRATQEVIASHFFLILSLLSLLRFNQFFWKNHRFKKVSWGLMSLVAGYLSTHFYHSAKILWPLLFVGQQALMTIVQFRSKNRLFWKRLIKQICLSSIIVVAITVGPIFLFPQTLDRFNDLSLFNQSDVQLVLDEQIRIIGHDAPVIITRGLAQLTSSKELL